MRAKKTKEHSSRERIWARVREICRHFPEASAGLSFGNPCVRAGRRPFVVLDCYKGEDCIFVYVARGLREDLLQDPAFFPAPYDPRERAICCKIPNIKWSQIKALILGSYRLIANKRMLSALENKTPQSAATENPARSMARTKSGRAIC